MQKLSARISVQSAQHDNVFMQAGSMVVSGSKSLGSSSGLSVEGDELVWVGGQVCDGNATLLPDKFRHAFQLLPTQSHSHEDVHINFKHTDLQQTTGIIFKTIRRKSGAES